MHLISSADLPREHTAKGGQTWPIAHAGSNFGESDQLYIFILIFNKSNIKLTLKI